MAMQDVTNEKDALEILGIPSESEPGAVVSTQPQQEVEVPVSTEPEAQQETEPAKEEKLTPAERARRWQSAHDRAQAELQAEKARAQALEQALAMTRELASRLKPEEPKEVRVGTHEPKLSDFTQGFKFDKYDAFDPDTPSGIAFQRYNQAREQWLIEQAVTKSKETITADTQRERQQRTLEARARKLAQKYPQFRDPLTQEPDFRKIQGWLSEVSEKAADDEWVTFMDYLDWKTKQNGNAAKVVEKTMTKLDRAANKAGSVAATSPVEDETEMSDDDKAFMKTFGQLPDLR